MGKTAIKVETANNVFLKFPGFFGTRYMFVGEKTDSELSENGEFAIACEACDVPFIRFLATMDNEDEKRYEIFIIKCSNRMVEKFEKALDLFGRKLQFKYGNYRAWANSLWDKLEESANTGE